MTTRGPMWSPEDTLNLRRITGVSLSPDGTRVAFAVTHAVTAGEESRYLTQVYLADPESGETRQLTSGTDSSYAPQWSPDGQAIAYLSRGDIWCVAPSEGHVRQVTNRPTGVSSFRWSPDGSMIAFTSVDEPTPKEARAVREKNDPRVGDRHVKRRRLYLLSVADLAAGPARGRPVTGSQTHVGAPQVPEAYAWSPDGRTLVFATSRSPRQNDWPTTRLARLNVEDGSVHPVGPDDAVAWDPKISPDGRWLAYKRYDHPAWEWSSVVHVLALAGGPARALGETFDRRPDVVGWSADGESLLFLETRGTRVYLGALPVNGGPPVVLYEPDGCIGSPSLARAGGSFACTLETTETPPEVYVTPLDRIAPARISHVHTEPRRGAIGRTDVIRWASTDGLEIEGLLTTPTGYERGRRYPLLLSVHGGPPIAWLQTFLGTQSFYGPAAAFAARGYAVLRCNVRGSTGRGKDFRRANFRDWGGMDVQDLLAGVDHVIDLGIADPQRLGITGWSYGGYLTAATITQTGRFKAAAIGAGMSDLVGYALGHDSPSFLPTHFGGEIWEVKDLLLERSPVAHADRVTTPTLIMHGELDVRVPIWQGYEFYHALERRGVPTQMVVYPRSGHVVTEPKLLLDVMNRILAWMELYVRGEEGS